MICLFVFLLSAICFFLLSARTLCVSKLSMPTRKIRKQHCHTDTDVFLVFYTARQLSGAEAADRAQCAGHFPHNIIEIVT